MAQAKIGVAYCSLANVRDKETNAQNAINACQKALEVYTVDKYPIRHEMAQNNLEYGYELLNKNKN